MASASAMEKRMMDADEERRQQEEEAIYAGRRYEEGIGLGVW